jgi:hypothetical protein
MAMILLFALNAGNLLTSLATFGFSRGTAAYIYLVTNEAVCLNGGSMAAVWGAL